MALHEISAIHAPRLYMVVGFLLVCKRPRISWSCFRVQPRRKITADFKRKTIMMNYFCSWEYVSKCYLLPDRIKSDAMLLSILLDIFCILLAALLATSSD